MTLCESHEGQPRPSASSLSPLSSCVALGDDGDRPAPPSPAFRANRAGRAAFPLRTELVGGGNWRSYREGGEPQGSHPCGVPVTCVTGTGRRRVTPSSVVAPCSVHHKDGRSPQPFPQPCIATLSFLPTGADSDGRLLWGPLLPDGKPDSGHLICIYKVCV